MSIVIILGAGILPWIVVQCSRKKEILKAEVHEEEEKPVTVVSENPNVVVENSEPPKTENPPDVIQKDGEKDVKMTSKEGKSKKSVKKSKSKESGEPPAKSTSKDAEKDLKTTSKEGGTPELKEPKELVNPKDCKEKEKEELKKKKEQRRARRKKKEDQRRREQREQERYERVRNGKYELHDYWKALQKQEEKSGSLEKTQEDSSSRKEKTRDLAVYLPPPPEEYLKPSQSKGVPGPRRIS